MYRMCFKKLKLILFLFSLVPMPLAATNRTASLWEITQADPRAKVLAQKVLDSMGGRKGWNDTRYLAWTFNDQYQIWDKKKNRFRWEMGNTVAVIDTQTKEGNVYVEGQELQDPAEKQKLLDRAYALFINNSQLFHWCRAVEYPVGH